MHGSVDEGDLMLPVIYSMSVSLDGFIAPGEKYDWSKRWREGSNGDANWVRPYQTLINAMNRLPAGSRRYTAKGASHSGGGVVVSKTTTRAVEKC